MIEQKEYADPSNPQPSLHRQHQTIQVRAFRVKKVHRMIRAARIHFATKSLGYL